MAAHPRAAGASARSAPSVLTEAFDRSRLNRRQIILRRAERSIAIAQRVRRVRLAQKTDLPLPHLERDGMQRKRRIIAVLDRQPYRGRVGRRTQSKLNRALAARCCSPLRSRRMASARSPSLCTGISGRARLPVACAACDDRNRSRSAIRENTAFGSSLSKLSPLHRQICRHCKLVDRLVRLLLRRRRRRDLHVPWRRSTLAPAHPRRQCPAASPAPAPASVSQNAGSESCSPATMIRFICGSSSGVSEL